MSFFIDKLAQEIKNEDYNLQELTIVLPSQRAKKYLQRALYKAYGKAIFSPKMITMNQWIQACNPRPVIDNSRALFKLYETHKACNKAEDLGLDEFLKWGRTLLSDFDEVDRYLIDAKQLFKNLTDIKEIENWSFNSDELTPAQQRFLEFWNSLPEYYKHFNSSLDKEEVCYMGAAYKYVANNISSVFKEDPSRRFIFAGFNAMSKAELSIIKQLYTMGRAKVYIDADRYYLDNKMHEAGSFLRQLQNTLETQKLDFIIDGLSTDEKKINIYNCVETTGQAKISASILQREIPVEKHSSTLVLLADETQIIPVIKNLPQNLQKANITLGLPLKNTALRSWIDLLFRFQENHIKYKSTSVYFKDFIQFIKHPFIHDILGEKDLEILLKLEHDIVTKNILFINLKKINLSQSCLDLFLSFFKAWDQHYTEAVKQIRTLNQMLYEQLDKSALELEKTIIVEFDKQMVSFQNLMNEFNPNIQLNTFKSLLNQHWFNRSIAYYGNPLDGVQIMGLLESRLLDFTHLIVIGLNNMKMPPGNPIQTLIPMDLRRHHGLPTPREKQGLFAHHFYRLLHQAKNIWITYSTATGAQGVEEPSQYIHQIKLELARKNKNVHLKEYDYTVRTDQVKQKPKRVPKTSAVIERLDAYFEKGTSISAINTYLRCPMDFYYQYVLGFGEEKKVEEEIEAGSLGSIIHETLEILYQAFLPQKDKSDKRPLKASDIDQMMNRYPKVLETVFRKYYEEENLSQVKLGKNYLSLKMAEHLLSSFLKKEKAFLTNEVNHLYIESLEESLQTELECEIGGTIKKIKIKGIIDRVDRVNGKLRIIDYKTGKCDVSKVLIKSHKTKSEKEVLLDTVTKGGNFILQLITYIKLYKDHHAELADTAGIISLVNLNDSPFELTNQNANNHESILLAYDTIMQSILEDIYDTEKPFEHNPKSQYCVFC